MIFTIFTIVVLASLIPTRLVSSLLFWITKKWQGGLQRLIIIHGATFATYGLLSALGLSEEYSVGLLGAIIAFLVPQLMWLTFDIYCYRNEALKLRKGALLVCISVPALGFAVAFFIGLMTTLGSSNLDDTFSVVNAAMEAESGPSSTSPSNQKLEALLVKELEPPYEIDKGVTLTSIAAFEQGVDLTLRQTGNNASEFMEEAEYWGAFMMGYFCDREDVLGLLSRGAKINLHYQTTNGKSQKGKSITEVACRQS